MYEAYPYPADGTPQLRANADVRLLLSYVESSAAPDRPLRALDAGCGRGAGVLGAAATQPDVHFLGIDINRVALAEARQEADARGIANVDFAEVDLMTLNGLRVPDGGFDVIYSSGVLHHLADPDEGLRQLRGALAPHGVIVLMLYGKAGREPLYRLIRAADVVARNDTSLAERIEPSRRVAFAMAQTTLKGSPWENTATQSEVEFVDRVLNVNERSYSIDELWQLLGRHSLRFLRWSEPEDWSLAAIADPILRQAAAQSSEFDRFRLIEQLLYRPSLELLVTGADCRSRQRPEQSQLGEAWFAPNPDVTFAVTTRSLRTERRVEGVRYRLRARAEVEVRGLVAQSLIVLSHQTRPFQGRELFAGLADLGASQSDAEALLIQLLDEELLYSPHS